MSGTGRIGEAARDTPARSALALALCVLAAIVLLESVQRSSAGRIEAARLERLAASLSAVLPDAPFDNEPARDRLLVEAAALGEGVRPVYRVRLGGHPVGAVLSVLAPDGYSAPIELLVGVHADGGVTAVRVVRHRETPGLGDRIERRRSDWITRFEGRAIGGGSAASARPRAWRVTRRGTAAEDVGRVTTFDALSGATITSRAVVQAVHRALVWFEANRDTVFAP